MITAFVANTPNGQCVAIALAESGLEHELRYVDLWSGAHQRARFLAINPAGQIPVLVDAATRTTVSQTAAILLFIAERTGKLLPETGPERTAALEWLMAQATDCSSIAVSIGRLKRRAISDNTPELGALVGPLRLMIGGYYRVLDLHLAASRYLAGESYSIADVLAYPFAATLSPTVPSGLPHISRWLDEVGSRSALCQALDNLERLHAAAIERRSREFQ